MKLPFGKYKDKDTSDPEVPTHYLKWFEENINTMSSALRADINAEIERREGDRPGVGKVVPRDRRIL
jgi:hypothetical protein